MLHTNTVDDVVMALAEAPIDPRTGNRVLYSVNWVADVDSMIGQPNPDWVRREMAWFWSGSDKLEDMEGPVPKLFQACGGRDGKVNSAYGHILFNEGDRIPRATNLYTRVLDSFLKEGAGTRHAVAIISDREVHTLATLNGRNDFICTNALNFMIDADNRLHIIAQMRSMDAVFGYRADYSMWKGLMNMLLDDLQDHGWPVTKGDITFQVANLHVYPRHLGLLQETADSIDEMLQRRVWRHENGFLLNREETAMVENPVNSRIFSDTLDQAVPVDTEQVSAEQWTFEEEATADERAGSEPTS